MGTFTTEHRELIDKVSRQFINGLINFEEVLQNSIGHVVHDETFDDPNEGGYCFDIYIVEPFYHYVKDFNVIEKSLLEFKIQARAEFNFKVIAHKEFAIIYISHETTL